jgi:hypothetical protein
MAVHAESRGGAGEAEPIGLLTEGAAGIAVIALTIVALAGVSAGVPGIDRGNRYRRRANGSGIQQPRRRVEGNVAWCRRECAERARSWWTACAVLPESYWAFSRSSGSTRRILLPPALIVFGGSLLLSGAMSMRPRALTVTGVGTETRTVSYQASPAAGLEVLDRARGDRVGDRVGHHGAVWSSGAGWVPCGRGRAAHSQRQPRRRGAAPVRDCVTNREDALTRRKQHIGRANETRAINQRR